MDDLNGDGKPDLVVANGTLNNIGVFLNTGAGSFAPGTFLGLSSAAFSVCLADFNSDGHLDILVLGGMIDAGGVVTPSLQILFGDGKGGFSVPAKLSTPGLTFLITLESTPAVADFNGDGFLDIAYPSRGADPAGPGAAVSVLLGDGKGNFSAALTSTIAFDGVLCCAPLITRELQVVDANNDGKPDLLIHVPPARGPLAAHYLALGDGKGGFANIVPLFRTFLSGSTGTIVDDLVASGTGDFNVDGNLDFLVNDGSSLSVLYGDGHGGFLYDDFPKQFRPPNNVFQFILDVDGDQSLDLLTVGGYLPGNGHGGFGDSITVPFPPGSLIAVADLNGDGKPDFVLQQNGSTDISVLLNNLVAPSTISASTATRLTASAAIASVGSSVTLIAKVSSGGGVAVGTVAFTDGTTSLGTAAVNIYGVAALKTSFTLGGLHTVAASFTGGVDAITHTTFANSSSDTVQVSVNNTPPTSQPPTLTMTSLVNPVRQNNLAGLQETLTASSGTPSGLVFFTADGDVLDPFGFLTFPVPGLHNLQAIYGGDGTFPPTTSATVVQDVRALDAVRTPSSIIINPVPVSGGFTVTVTVNGGSSQPTGVINLRVDGGVLFTGRPDFTFRVNAPPGTYTVAAEYFGDAVLAPSSSSIKVVVGLPPAPDYTVSASPQNATITAGQTAMFMLTVTPSGGFSSAVSFACATLPAGANCSFSPSSVTPNGTPVSVNLAITTTAPHTAGVFKTGSQPSFYALAATLTFGLVLVGGRRRRKTLAVAGLSVVALLAGCGGGGSSTPPNVIPGTPKGTTTITVMASSLANHNVPITLTVN